MLGRGARPAGPAAVWLVRGRGVGPWQPDRPRARPGFKVAKPPSAAVSYLGPKFKFRVRAPACPKIRVPRPFSAAHQRPGTARAHENMKATSPLHLARSRPGPSHARAAGLLIPHGQAPSESPDNLKPGSVWAARFAPAAYGTSGSISIGTEVPRLQHLSRSRLRGTPRLVVRPKTLYFLFCGRHGAARVRVHRLPGLRPAADPVGLCVPIRHRPSARRLPHQESSGATAAPRQRGVVGVPDVRSVVHGGDANGARGGVVVAGVRRGGGERRAACRGG
jgi:hypothetical protein